MKKEDKMNKLKLELIIKDDTIGMDLKERREYYQRLADYLLIRCHNDAYDECHEECKSCRRCLE
jgi:hypothetical protein